MPDDALVASRVSGREWQECASSPCDRAPGPYWLVALAVGALGAAALLVNASLGMRSGRPLGESDIRELLVGTVMGIYIVACLRILKGKSVIWLARLRPAVEISEVEFARQARRLLCSDWRVEVLLGLLSVGIMALLATRSSYIRRLDLSQTPDLVAGALVVLFFAVTTWLVLSMVYSALRIALGLRALAAHPLEINVFDPALLLPFGRLSLLYTVAFAGLLLIPLVLLGTPTAQGGGIVLILLTVIGLVALFVPLWGVHTQMVRARETMLEELSERLMAVQRVIEDPARSGPAETEAAGKQVEALTLVRSSILSQPSWPFRGVLSFSRAVLAAASPLIYFILEKLLDRLLLIRVIPTP
jgi:hypothetical protein